MCVCVCVCVCVYVLFSLINDGCNFVLVTYTILSRNKLNCIIKS